MLRCFFVCICFFVEFCFIPKAGKALTKDWIVVLGTGGLHGAAYKKEIFRTLGQANARLLLCAPKESPLKKDLKNEGLVHEVLSLNAEDEVEAFEAISHACKNRHIRGIFTVREDYLTIASKLAQTWKLPYQDPEAFCLAQDKEKTRQKLAACGLKSVPYMVLTQADLRAKKRPFDRPFFIKPRDGIRSEFVRRISSQKEWESYVRDVQGKAPQSFLAEMEIVGHEVDVDMFLKHGEILYAAVSDNFPCHRPFSLETGQLSPSLLPSSVQKEVEDYAEKAVKALGFRQGNLHVEVMVQPDGAPVLIEVNGRLGGMYIPFWHRDIWGVDLIRAQLALALGEDPSPFLQKKTPEKAYAQLCVTSNTEGALYLTEGDKVLEWKNRDAIGQMNGVARATLWDPLPFTVHPKANGHPNLGEITISGENPRETFQNLFTLCTNAPPVLQTSRGEIASSLWPLRSFGCMMPGLERFSVTDALPEDIEDIQKLLQTLTSRAAGALTELPKKSRVLVARDRLTPNQAVVGTVAYHIWDQLRSSPDKWASYIQDLVVAEPYRGLGIGTRLMTEAKRCMREEGVSKITLAYEAKETQPDNPLNNFYGAFGFSPVGIFMVQYLPDAPFDTDFLANEGDWLYGQHLVEKFGKDKMGEAFVLSPPYRIVDPASLSEDSLEGLSGSYAVKFSRAGQDFTGGGIRGGNTSRGRRIDMENPEQALEALRGFADNAPKDALKIVLQRFIDQTGGCLFHAEASRYQSEIELLWETNTCTGRYFTLFKEGRWIGDDIIKGKGQGCPENRKEAGRDILKHLTKFLAPLQNTFGTNTWSIEGFWNPNHGKITVLQLRPTPLDRPLRVALLPKRTFYETSFVWGDFETAPFILSESAWPEDIVVSRDTFAKTLPDALMARLQQKKKTLLIHQERGFALSHEPWFLPPPECRPYFGFLYIPASLLNTYTGQKVQFLSNGGKGYGSVVA